MKGSQTIFAIIIVFCLTATAALLSGCDRKANAKMTEIEAVLDDALDSAEIIPAIRSLDSIPVDELGDRNRALHALLTVHSRHKQHLPLSSDSLIFKEAAYFDGSSDTYHRMKWHFYRGATRLELQDYRGAILDALHAARLSEQLPDTLFMAKSEGLLGDIYGITFNSDLAIEHIKKSAELYKSAGKPRNTLFQYLDLATELQFLGRNKEVITLCDSIIKLSSTDSIILGHAYSHMATAYSRDGMITDARNALRQAVKYYGDGLIDCANIDFIANCFTRTNDIDSVQKYVNICSQLPEYQNDIIHIENLKWLAEHKNNYKQAHYYADSVIKLTNITAKDILSQQGVFAQADYYLWQLSLEKDKSHHKTMFLIIVVVSSIILISLIRIQYINRQTKLQIQIESRITEISQLQDEISQLGNELTNAKLSTESKNHFKEILTAGFSTFNALTKQYSSNKKTSISNGKEINDSLQAVINPLKNEHFLNAIVDYANYEYSDVITKFTKLFPKTKKTELYLIALRLSGFSVQSICVLLDITSTNYYTRWHRLRERISNIDTPDRTFFSEIFK